MEEKDEETHRLAELKQYLSQKKEMLEEELEKLNSLISVVDDLLASKSFKTGIEVMKRAEEKTEAEAALQKLELVYKGTKVGEMEVYQTYAKVTPLPELKLSTVISPFEAFLVRKVLEPMRERDVERAAKNELRPDQMFSYDIIEEGGILKYIVVRNFRDRIRLKELANAMSWTFFTMASKKGSVQTGLEESYQA
ncbi:MAG: hypothetical protein NZ873_00720 [Crenarchaeota archaeon]|nr:hypothetical protein [Thermoproteota archaeon]MDW8033692.1 hypothetical protein [Nitrososphaerota archaeon]